MEVWGAWRRTATAIAGVLGALGLTFAPGATASDVYVPNLGSNDVSQYDVGAGGALAAKAAPTVPAGSLPFGIAISPSQAPIAAFTASPGDPGSPTSFDASASSDPDGTIARYAWDFGDGTGAADAGPAPSHTYASPGTYVARLTLTDDQGCSTELVFTGQTAYCNGSAQASTTRTVTVSEPPPGPDPTPPDPALEVVGLERDRKAGTATLTVAANVAGNLNVDKTDKVKGFGPATLAQAGQAELEVVPRNRAAKKLEKKGRLTVNPRIRLFAENGSAAIRHEFRLRRD